MKHINLLLKPASSLCNLRCRYCFYADEASHRSKCSMGIMTAETADRVIARTFEAIEPGGVITFSFQGGEPTLAGLPFFRHFTETVRKHCPPGVRVLYAIQTNGTLLNEAWAAFLKANHFLVGLSIDGTRAIHNENRLTDGGEGTWKQVLSARSLLVRFGVECNVLCVVTAQCAAQPEAVYRSLKGLGFDYLQFIACLDSMNRPRGGESWSLTPQGYGDFLCRLFDRWYDDWRSGCYRSIRLFDDYVHILMGHSASTCAACGQCGGYLVVEADGSVYPCDFYALDAWRIGSLVTQTMPQLMGSAAMEAFLSMGAVLPVECESCPHRRICRGGCKNDWFTDETGVHNYHCGAIRRLLDHALPRMQQMAQSGSAAGQ